MPKAIKATIFIPTYNGADYLAAILEAIFGQAVDFEYEVLIIDSGSTDSTLDIIQESQARHRNLRLHQIPNSEFGHGKTRNLAAQMAHGEIVVYLSHDAVPATADWLYEIVAPFAISNKVAGVVGKQIPRRHCIPMLKSEIRSTFSKLGPDTGTALYFKDRFVGNQSIRDAISYYSDVNSAARRDYLLGPLPYKDVAYAEDQLFGRDIIEGGYYKVYAPRGVVEHSNDLKLDEYKHRMFDETLGLMKVGYPMTSPSLRGIFRSIARGAIRDTPNILRDPDYSFKRKVYWLVFNPLYHVEKWRGIRIATMTKLDDSQKLDQYSLEKRSLRKHSQK